MRCAPKNMADTLLDMTSASNAFPDSDGNHAGRAATMLLVAGLLEVAGFGLLVLSCISAATMSLEEMQQLKLDASQMELITNFKKIAWPTAIAITVLGVAPGIAYIALSIGVRASRYVATQIAMLLIATQFIVFGILFLASAGEAMMQMKPAMLTLNVVTLGTLLMVLAFTFQNLMRARIAAKLKLTSDKEPWDSPDE